MLTRETPGITELLLRESMKIEPSPFPRVPRRRVGRTLIINLGRPHAVGEPEHPDARAAHALLGIEERIEEGEGGGDSCRTNIRCCQPTEHMHKYSITSQHIPLYHIPTRTVPVRAAAAAEASSRRACPWDRHGHRRRAQLGRAGWRCRGAILVNGICSANVGEEEFMAGVGRSRACLSG